MCFTVPENFDSVKCRSLPGFSYSGQNKCSAVSLELLSGEKNLISALCHEDRHSVLRF